MARYRAIGTYLFGLQDGIALFILLRKTVPLFELAIPGHMVLQPMLFLAWMGLVLASPSGGRLWQALTWSRGAFIGVCGYLTYLVIIVVLGHGLDAVSHLSAFLNAIPLYVMGCYYGGLFPTRFWRLCRIAFIVLGVQAAYSIPTLLYEEEIVRKIMKSIDEGRLLQYAFTGVGTYALYSGNGIVAAVIAGFCINYSEKLPSRLVFCAALVCIIVANILSTFAAATLVGILGTLTVLALGTAFGKIRLQVLVATFVGCVLGGVVFITLVQQSVAYDVMYRKIISIFVNVGSEGLEADPTTRGELIFVSLDAWLSAPICGIGAGGVKSSGSDGASVVHAGGHCSWLDILAYYGIVGAIWFYLILLSIGRRIVKVWCRNKADVLAGSLLVCFVCYIVFGFIDVIHRITNGDFALLFVLSGGSLALLRKKTQSHLVLLTSRLSS